MLSVGLNNNFVNMVIVGTVLDIEKDVKYSAVQVRVRRSALRLSTLSTRSTVVDVAPIRELGRSASLLGSLSCCRLRLALGALVTPVAAHGILLVSRRCTGRLLVRSDSTQKADIYINK